MKRRSWLLGAGVGALLPLARAQSPALGLEPMAKQGGVLLIRHASTEAGLGDPPGFVLGVCSTQRNLSDAGRLESMAMGAWFRRLGLPVGMVLSSQWCRCQDTARLAFGRYQDWPALNSTFAGQGQHERQIAALKEQLQQRVSGTLEVWVTHQVIMTGLTGAFPAMGEGFLVDATGTLQARGMMRSGS